VCFFKRVPNLKTFALPRNPHGYKVFRVEIGEKTHEIGEKTHEIGEKTHEIGEKTHEIGGCFNSSYFSK
jgi:hypothetical protein